jgi:DNA-binding transcriptional ArsR family regulator
MSNIEIDADRLAAMFKALAHPQRLRMFVKLAAACCGPAAGCAPRGRARYCCAGQVGAGLALAPSTVSHHLKELRQAGLMQVERRGRTIECSVTDDTLRLLASFFERCGGTQPARTAAKPGRVASVRGGRP